MLQISIPSVHSDLSAHVTEACVATLTEPCKSPLGKNKNVAESRIFVYRALLLHTCMPDVSKQIRSFVFMCEHLYLEINLNTLPFAKEIDFSFGYKTCKFSLPAGSTHFGFMLSLICILNYII